MSNLPTLPLKTLDLLGLKQKDMDVYLGLVKLGSAPLRTIAQEVNLNRGTTYDALRRLMDLGIVTYLDAKSHRHFTAEDPQRLRGLATRREVALQEARANLDEVIPVYQQMLGWSKRRPTVRFYEGSTGVRSILEDVLSTTERAETKLIRVYSVEGIRDLIAASWPAYNKNRIRRKLKTRAIALGVGGTTHGMDERKWLGKSAEDPSYMLIYPGKMAIVSLDEKKELFGVVIDDEATSKTSTLVFDSLWKQLN